MVVAIALFWALGAYNRLMRLRSAVAQAFGSLDAHLVRLVALLGEFGAAHASQQQPVDAALGPSGAGGSVGAGQEMTALQGATVQLSASLAVARARPLDASGVAALTAARDVLHATWQAAARKAQEAASPTPQAATPATTPAGEAPPVSAPKVEAPSPAANPSLGPSHWQVCWDEHQLQNDQAVRVFNDAVSQYNEAIAQFPASVLAWVFGFKAARGL